MLHTCLFSWARLATHGQVSAAHAAPPTERRYTANMNPIEAMDFVKDRLEKTRDNDEFLMSMNS